MSHGAYHIHKEIREALEDYIKTQYFAKSPILYNKVKELIDKEGLLYQQPYIESSPAYKSVEDGISKADLPTWLKIFFNRLAQMGLGVYNSPFLHQIKALEEAYKGRDLFVSTGTGSGKTECFIWPLISKITAEAKESNTWEQRGVRTIIMYPMNALVSDQISRLRRLIGDPEDKYISLLRETCGASIRRPQFGMYTGRTPYAGEESDLKQDRELNKTLQGMVMNTKDIKYYDTLVKEGKIPAKKNMNEFLNRLYNGEHMPDAEDTELITRFEMQKYCPDILITNYSMLEYMLFRSQEQNIWKQTREWLNLSSDNKLLFIIDEAHMYKGAAGGEVALLLRRLFYKLGIERDRVQFILTTASMPNTTTKDDEYVKKFAINLTGGNSKTEFCYLTGDREEIEGKDKYDIPFEKFKECDIESIERQSLEEINKFWNGVENSPREFTDNAKAYYWLYDNLIYYRPFYKLIKECRGTAVSLNELAIKLFPTQEKNDALKAISVLLAIATLACNDKGVVLFPARMHMLFKGISGVYACSNENCKHAHVDKHLTLGEIYLSDENLVCPHCNSMVYELLNDRRCGTVFFKGFVLADEIKQTKNAFLWRYSDEIRDKQMKEVHLYIPPMDFINEKTTGKYPLQACYLDVKSGFINFKDDSWEGMEDVRKLYYCNYETKGRPDILTFTQCPHCKRKLGDAELTTFNTKGNYSFYSLIKKQFELQPSVKGKEHLPNQGRKVLLFSDSRQRAAKLARDMSNASDRAAARQLFFLAVEMLQHCTDTSKLNLNYIYDYLCIAAKEKNVHFYSDNNSVDFIKNCKEAYEDFEIDDKDLEEYEPERTISDDATDKIQELFLETFCGGYNMLYDFALVWLQPSEPVLKKIKDKDKIKDLMTEDDFLEVFNAWLIHIFDRNTALGNAISNQQRYAVRPFYGEYGLEKNWKFPSIINDIMQWDDMIREKIRNILNKRFLGTNRIDGDENLFVKLKTVKPCFDLKHKWYQCEQCSGITAFKLKNKCPRCGSSYIHIMNSTELEALDFWRKQMLDSINGESIRVIDTEEHTAQLSYKDQRNDMWSKTEEYELKFQDLIKDNEMPVDILSSTTTMEVGIDIGSLVAVGLRNIPPMRENYQQRAGRAGRRGASLSTIVTFCADSPHDNLYFNNPVPMFRGEPRRPWIDVENSKLLTRHISIIILQQYLYRYARSLDKLDALTFLDDNLEDCKQFIKYYTIKSDILIPDNVELNLEEVKQQLINGLEEMKRSRDRHPELFGIEELPKNRKTILDALYEESLIPTYSFPKNVVGMYIGKHKVERGLDLAISEYAPGRAIVVDKVTYQVGGLYYPKFNKKDFLSPAKKYIEDYNYNKGIVKCPRCEWIGLKSDDYNKCPFCGEEDIKDSLPMIKPWGFAPINGKKIPEAQVNEEYTSVNKILYSTLPLQEDISSVDGCKNIRMAIRQNQRMIMQNRGGRRKEGFLICTDCGAAIPANRSWDNVGRPYNIKYRKKCSHATYINANLGYDFITDMLVLEFRLDKEIIETSMLNDIWMKRAGQTLAEALRLAVSKEIDIDYTELVTGHRIRHDVDISCIDVFIYDSLSSGAGYAVSIVDIMPTIIDNIKQLLQECVNNCDSACYGCLKHYRNQNVHGILDRQTGLELLKWGIHGENRTEIDIHIQEKLLSSIKNIMMRIGYNIELIDNKIMISKGKKKKQIVVYPAMWKEPYDTNIIYVSDLYLKYSKPYAVDKIIKEM